MSSHASVVYHTRPPRMRLRAVAALAVWLIALAVPSAAFAHGAVDPEASDDLATITHLPTGIHARIVDGDLRVWMSVRPSMTVIVLDYQGGRFLRFDARGVQVNQNSPMYYLNLTPQIAPSIKLTPQMAPDWHRVSGGHSDVWHDGRLAALSQTLQAPGARVLGRWTLPLLVDGRREAISGVLRHRPRPTLAWWWPLAAALLILPALLRLRDRALERRICRPIAAVTILAAATEAVGAGLHGRPGVTGWLVAIMVTELAVLGWSALRLLRGKDGPLSLGLIAIVAGYRGLVGVAVLWRGYVLLAIPALVGRASVAVCLAGAVSLAVVAVWTLDLERRPRQRRASA
ncbi:MAG TPA: hypothetical protein VMF07_03090 [Solirubrobacteraceae bacterium]|nr:hypothetical protein [Solirubrobacteraceae bacterium]